MRTTGPASGSSCARRWPSWAHGPPPAPSSSPPSLLYSDPSRTSRRLRVKLGYKASAEQFRPRELVDLGTAAERHGMDSVAISDHFQPWRHTGGHAPSSSEERRVGKEVGSTCRSRGMQAR